MTEDQVQLASDAEISKFQISPASAGVSSASFAPINVVSHFAMGEVMRPVLHETAIEEQVFKGLFYDCRMERVWTKLSERVSEKEQISFVFLCLSAAMQWHWAFASERHRDRRKYAANIKEVSDELIELLFGGAEHLEGIFPAPDELNKLRGYLLELRRLAKDASMMTRFGKFPKSFEFRKNKTPGSIKLFLCREVAQFLWQCTGDPCTAYTAVVVSVVLNLQTPLTSEYVRQAVANLPGRPKDSSSKET